jgi:ribose-phosphate pyrophosphokinase
MSNIIYRDGGGITIIDFAEYPSGEPLIRFAPSQIVFTNGIKNGGRKLLVRPATMNQFVGAMFFVDAFADRYGDVPELILPFVPGARQDRQMEGGGDFLFTAKSVAKMINARNFPSVTIFDPHSDVISGLIDRCVAVSPAQIFNAEKKSILAANSTLPMYELEGEFTGVIAPDSGATKRAMGVAKHLGLPLFVGGKTRETKTGKITDFWIHDLPSKGHFLIVDDICDGGGTFIGLADKINKISPDVELSLYVTHGLFTKGLESLKIYFKNIISTDSVVGTKEMEPWTVKTINVCNYFMGVQL